MLFDANSSADEITKEVTTNLNEALTSNPRLTHELSERLEQPSTKQPEVAVVEDNPFIGRPVILRP